MVANIFNQLRELSLKLASQQSYTRVRCCPGPPAVLQPLRLVKHACLPVILAKNTSVVFIETSSGLEIRVARGFASPRTPVIFCQLEKYIAGCVMALKSLQHFKCSCNSRLYKRFFPYP